MSEFCFGVGVGKISKKEISRRKNIARLHDIDFVVQAGNAGQCQCGRGCKLDACAIKRFWFAAPNQGEPHNMNIRKQVLAKV